MYMTNYDVGNDNIQSKDEDGHDVSHISATFAHYDENVFNLFDLLCTSVNKTLILK